eukprot:996405-Alexandrium_andersonii.AAC.1
MDYYFLTEGASDATLTVLAIKGRDSWAILAHPVLREGRLRDDTVDQAVASIHRLGHRLDPRRAVAECLG